MASLHTTIFSARDTFIVIIHCGVRLSIYTRQNNEICCHGLHWQLRADDDGNNLLRNINTEYRRIYEIALRFSTSYSNTHARKKYGWTETRGKSEFWNASDGSINVTTATRSFHEIEWWHSGDAARNTQSPTNRKPPHSTTFRFH